MRTRHLNMIECGSLVLPFGLLDPLERKLDVFGIKFADDLVRRAIMPLDAWFEFENDGLGIHLLDMGDKLAGRPRPVRPFVQGCQLGQAGVLQDRFHAAHHVARIRRHDRAIGAHAQGPIRRDRSLCRRHPRSNHRRSRHRRGGSHERAAVEFRLFHRTISLRCIRKQPTNIAIEEPSRQQLWPSLMRDI